jgi:hypothetical protein
MDGEYYYSFERNMWISAGLKLRGMYLIIYYVYNDIEFWNGKLA